MIGVTVLGATGSIGTSTLDVLARHRDRFRIVALTARSEADRLYERCAAHSPEYAVMVDPEAAQRLEHRLRASGLHTKVLVGVDGLQEVSRLPQADYVMAAIVGAAGLLPTLEAARAGKRILLANKEALVMSGHLFMDEVHRSGATLLPIDSEHNAVFQCLPAGFATSRDKGGVRRVLLTASGGPFRDWPLDALGQVTPEQACKHPNWVMGRKISVDSATMMNKGLEVIEACWLFDASPDQVEVVIHPQSVIHSMVEYIDGSVLAQLGNPDMRTPIAHALGWPDRIESGVSGLDIFAVGRLDFQRPDVQRFPCLRLAYQAVRAGGTAPTILNAANEIAVQAFLDGTLPYMQIPEVIEATLDAVTVREAVSLNVILEDDGTARDFAARHVSTLLRRAV